MRKELVIFVITTALLSLVSVLVFCITSIYSAETKIELLQEQIKNLQSNNTKDEDQDRQLKLLWKYATWLHTQDNTVRFKLQLPPESPDFSN